MVIETTAVSIAFGAIEFLTTLITLFRLAFRLRQQRFWWEDAWAAIAVIGATTFTITILIYSHTQKFSAAYVANWIFSYAFTSVVWSVRMSLLYSIVRITSPSACLRKFMRVIAALFVITWALITLKTWWCTKNVRSEFGHLTCHMMYPMAIFEVTTDVAGDVTLVTLSIRHFWKVNLPRRRRRMILSVFSFSAVMSASSLLRAIAQFMNKENLLVIFLNMEVILSMIVCNLLVVVTYIYRVCTSSSRLDSSFENHEDFTGAAVSLTAVDLDLSSLDSTSTGLLPNQTS